MPYIYCPYCDQKIWIDGKKYVETKRRLKPAITGRVQLDDDYKNKRDGIKIKK